MGQPVVRGYIYAARVLVWIVLHAARHWFTAWPLLAWPELAGVAVLISVRPRERSVVAAWAMWFAVVVSIQSLGVWLAVLKGWAGNDDVPALIVSAFLASFVAVPAATWLSLLVFDKLSQSAPTVETSSAQKE